MTEKKDAKNQFDLKKPKHLLLPVAVLLEIGAVILAVRAGAVLAAANDCSKLLPGQLASWLLALAGLLLAVGGGIIFFRENEKPLKVLAVAIVIICLALAVAAWALSVLCMSY